MTASSVRIRLRFFPIIGILWLSVALSAFSQENWNPTSNPIQKVENTDDKLTIKVNVEEIRLDAVVEDWRGRLITDLTAEDFEIYQDGRKQDLTSCQYISLRNQYRIEPRTFPQIPTPPLKRDSVERTLIFLINDFHMAFEDTYWTRMGLRKFVEEQMLPGDLVSIIKTSRGNATLQSFTSDKRELLARIETIQWSTYNNPPTYIPRVVELRKEHNFQLQAINYCIKALHDMPSRKFLMLITAYHLGPSYFYPTYDRMADAAFRAGVVINTLKMGEITFVPEFLTPRFLTPDIEMMSELSRRFDQRENINGRSGFRVGTPNI
jgi:VWFA-related protein